MPMLSLLYVHVMQEQDYLSFSIVVSAVCACDVHKKGALPNYRAAPPCTAWTITIIDLVNHGAQQPAPPRTPYSFLLW